MRVLVTRPRRDAETTAEALRARGQQPLLSPVMEIVATRAPVTPGAARALIATSAHALELLDADTARNLAGLPLFVVGARTAQAARDRGFAPPQACTARAEDLVPRITRALPHPAPLLYLAGQTRKPDLEAALHAAGYPLEVVVVYAARPAPCLTPAAIAALRAGKIDATLHFSGRSASLFTKLIAREGLAAQVMKVRHICISADAARSLEGRVVIAPTPDIEGLFAALEAV